MTHGPGIYSAVRALTTIAISAVLAGVGLASAAQVPSAEIGPEPFVPEVIAAPALDVADEVLATPFPLVAEDIAIRDLLNRIAQVAPGPVVFDDKLKGQLTLDNAGGTIADALDAASARLALTYWDDGVVLHIESRSDMVSRLLPTGGVGAEEALTQLASFGFDDPRFAMAGLGDGAMIRVVGPKGYAEAVAEALDQLAAERARLQAAAGASGQNPDEPPLPNIIRGTGPMPTAPGQIATKP